MALGVSQSERKHDFEMLKATGLEADRLKHEQEETNRKAILEQQRLREVRVRTGLCLRICMLEDWVS